MTSSLPLRIARRIRTFDIRATFRNHPFVIYNTMCLCLVAWANWAQHKRLAPMFPNFDEFRKNEGGRMMNAKQQELADVMRYNNMVNNMRSDLRR